VLTASQIQAPECKQDEDAAHGEIEAAHPGYLGSQDTFYVGAIKGIGRIYQQIFVDTYSKWDTAKLYTTNTPITAADLLNDRLLPFFAEQGLGMIRILTDRCAEYCGKPESPDYQLYLALNDIEHTKPRPCSRRLTVYESVSIRPSCKSFTRSRSGARFIDLSKGFKLTWINGCPTITMTECIKARCVADALRCKR